MICREFISKHVESIATKIDPELDIVEEIERQVKSFFFGERCKTFCDLS